jgi:hypothetical protein
LRGVSLLFYGVLDFFLFGVYEPLSFSYEDDELLLPDELLEDEEDEEELDFLFLFYWFFLSKYYFISFSFNLL